MVDSSPVDSRDDRGARSPRADPPGEDPDPSAIDEAPALEGGTAGQSRTQSAGRVVLACVPAGLTLYLAFNAGGFFVGAPAALAVAVGLGLVLRLTLAEQPFAGLGLWVIVPAAAAGLLAVWILASAWWSSAPALAMAEFDRALLYWLVLVLFGSFPRDRRTLSIALKALAAALAVIAVVAVATRVLPDVFPTEVAVANDRLSYPLTYWNALGLMMAVGIVFTMHISTAMSERPGVRALAAAAIPLMAVTIYFTFSRGSLVALLVGLTVWAVLARPRTLLTTVTAVLPPAAIAVFIAYQADLLATGRFDTPAGVDQGHGVALAVLACVVAAALVRLALARSLDARLDRVEISSRVRRRLAVIAVALPLLAALAAGVALDGRSFAQDQYERFVEGEGIDDSGGDLRGRFTEISNNGRLDQWGVAIDAFAEMPVIGHGAGTFSRVFAVEGRELKVEDAHSLYLEVLAELGVPGLALVLVTVGGLLVGVLLTARRKRSGPATAVFAAGLMWALHAGIDWDWEMPATALWLFALGGLACARGEETSSARAIAPSRVLRLACAVGCLALLATPAVMGLSQNRLNAAVAALKEGDCGVAAARALSAAEVASVRPEPFQVLSYCNSRVGEHELAIRMADAAVSRDREKWDSYYALALAQAAGGVDPRAAARTAYELNPRNPLTQRALELFDTDDPQQWKRRAQSARLPIL